MQPELRRLMIADDPAAWAEAGFAVEDGQTVIDGVTVVLSPDADRKGIVSWALSGVVTESIDGLPTAAAPPEDAPPATATHPNGTTAIDHVVVASPDLARTVAALAQLGIDSRRTRDTGLHGAPMRQVFFRLGRPILELIGPPEPAGTESASFWGLALAVADLDATKERLGELVSDPKEAVQPGRRIATLRHRELGITVPIAFLSV
jgi:hypothetical protein